MIQHTQEKTIQDLEAALKGGVLNLYREDCIGRSGDCSDNGRAYGDVMAEHLLDRAGFVDALRLQKAVTRTTSYFPVRNEEPDAPDPSSQRLEEQLVKQWVNVGRHFEHLGKCVYFQMPLSNTEADAFGAVDLVTYEANVLRALPRSPPLSQNMALCWGELKGKLCRLEADRLS